MFFLHTDINECDSDPCANNGTCIDMVNGFVCNCTAGFVGVFCMNGEFHLERGEGEKNMVNFKKKLYLSKIFKSVALDKLLPTLLANKKKKSFFMFDN